MGTTTVSQRNTLSTIVDIFVSPREAFASIKERPTVLVPMFLLCIAAAAPAWLYLLEVDIGWLVERQLGAQRFIDLSEEQIRTMADAAADRGRGFTIAQSVVGTLVFVGALLLIQALYLKIVSAFRKDGVRYKQWLSLVSWASLPAILGSIASVVFVLTNDVSFVEQTAINPLSFGNLLQLDRSNPDAPMTLAMNLSPIYVWSLILVFLGYRAISGAGVVTAAAVLLAPLLFIAAIVIALI
jgi:hypothetical protein